MAGINPGMVIKVAADVKDAMAAFVDVVAASANTAAAVGDINDAYKHLGDQAPDALGDVEDATKEIDDATGDVKTSVVALGTAIGSFAANAATAILDLAFDAMKELGREVWSVIDGALELGDRWSDFKDRVSDVIRETGVMETGLQTLKRQLLETFGVTEQEAIAAIGRKANDGAIAFVDWAITLTEWAGTAARVFGMVRQPIDAITVAINYLVTGWLDGLGKLYEAAGHMPGLVGDGFEKTAVKIKASADSWREVRDRTYDAMLANEAMIEGTGAVHNALKATKAALEETRDAMKEQAAATAVAKDHSEEFAAAQDTVQGSMTEATWAILEQNRALADMDEWSSNIKNKNAFGFLLENLDRTKPALEQTAVAMDTVKVAAIDLSDQVKFSAEVVATATQAALSWNDAMELVRQGKGTMTGTIGKPTKPAGMSEMEFQQMQKDPRTWEILHGWDWQSPGGTGSTWKWLDWQAPAGGTTNVTNINVSSVAGDKQAIAAVVKDALADDWRNQGRKG